jgi:peptide/nickel transport system permease protein
VNDPAVAESLEPARAARERIPAVATALRALRFRRTQIGLALTGVVVAIALVGPFLAPNSPTDFSHVPFTKPGGEVKAGTDYLGRDVLSRVLWGGRSVLVLAALSASLGVFLGVAAGMLAGYSRAWLDEAVMRVLDVLLAFPQIVFTLLLVSMVGTKLWLIVVAVAITHIPRTARIVRGATLEVVERDFVKRAEVLGVPRLRILFGEILPNISSPVLVEFGLRLTYSIGIVAGLSFLGFGLQPPSPDWGLMINENRIGLTLQPWPVILPAVLIAVLTIGTNLVTDGLARALIGIDRGGSDR